MVIPWVGIPARRASSSAPSRRRRPRSSSSRRCCVRREMPGQQPAGCSTGPTSKGCGMDEAMHPLTILAVGLYGKTLLNQNGAPIRLVVPWKYGFKSIKSIVRIRFVDKQPRTAWQTREPRRVRLLLEREPGGRSSALEPGHASGASASSSTPADADVQRLRRPGRVAVRRHGSRRSTTERDADRCSPACRSRLRVRCSSLAPACRWLVVARRSPTTLGANPVEDAARSTTGIWALRFLLADAGDHAAAAAHRLERVIQYRRMLGLFAFFYATLHLLTYVVLDQGLRLRLHPRRRRQAAVHHRWA